LIELYQSAQPQADSSVVDRIAATSAAVDLAYVKANLPRILSRTREGIDRVTRIVHSLRGMARTEAPRRQETRIPDIITNSLEILHGKYKRLGVAIEQHHDPHPYVSCVPTQISQVVLNLLVNAFQAIEASQRTDGKLVIRTIRRGAEFVLEIQDNGDGVKPEHLPRLFDPFFTTKDVGEGTGLGLSISHHIVTAHGGRIEVDSSPDAGTCFRVILPLEPMN
jgi:signal transduction histidine kinase